MANEKVVKLALEVDDVRREWAVQLDEDGDVGVRMVATCDGHQYRGSYPDEVEALCDLVYVVANGWPGLRS